MRCSTRFEPSACRVHALAIGVLFVPLSFLPAGANVIPESAILIHVQPVSEVSCATEITQCSQIVRSTTEQGRLEFLLFVYPIMYEELHYGILDLNTLLTVPDAWTISDWELCGGGFGYLFDQGNGYALHIEWPECPTISGQIMLVARLVIDVNGPGRLGFADPYGNPIRLRCEDPLTAHAFGADAEAGMGCEINTYQCGQPEYCTPDFSEAGLNLVAHAGESAAEELRFHASVEWCYFSASSEAPWLEASVAWVPEDWEYCLQVTADAGDLAPGSYQAQIQVTDLNDNVTRCVEVLFEVLESSSVADPESPAVEARTWGRIKGGYR